MAPRVTESTSGLGWIHGVSSRLNFDRSQLVERKPAGLKQGVDRRDAVVARVLTVADRDRDEVRVVLSSEINAAHKKRLQLLALRGNEHNPEAFLSAGVDCFNLETVDRWEHAVADDAAVSDRIEEPLGNGLISVIRSPPSSLVVAAPRTSTPPSRAFAKPAASFASSSF
jgi:hypothetical protein